MYYLPDLEEYAQELKDEFIEHGNHTHIRYYINFG